MCVKGITSDKKISFDVNAPRDGEYTIDAVYSNANSDESGRISAYVRFSVNGEKYEVKCHSSVKEDCMECVSFKVFLEKGKNTIEVLPYDHMAIALDFIDITPYDGEKVYFEKLSSRNTDKKENAYSVFIPEDGFYRFSDFSVKGNIVINSVSLPCDGNNVFFFSRGYNKVVLPDASFFTGVEKEDSEVYLEITPGDMKLYGGASDEEDSNTSTGRHIGWISSDTQSSAEFAAEIPQSGYYALTFEYSNNEEGGYHDYNVDLVERYVTISVNGEKQDNFFFRSTYSFDNYKTKTIMLYLEKGENLINLSNDGSYSFNNKVTYAPDIGKVTLNYYKPLE